MKHRHNWYMYLAKPTKVAMDRHPDRWCQDCGYSPSTRSYLKVGKGTHVNYRDLL